MNHPASDFGGTIAAIATAVGRAGVGIIRLSGPAAVSVARRLIPDLPAQPPTHRLLLRRFVDPASGELLDRGLVVVMTGPRSFTGEDVVELHAHGGPLILSTLLEALIAAGARPAAPGEFTRRAFLNGRLDLVQAEALADLIDAKSQAARRLAQRHLEGDLSRQIVDLRERLSQALVLVESAIDFSLEEHVYALDRATLDADLGVVGAAIEALLATYDRGRRVRDGVRCVIAGRPNAGKSTLLNRLLAHERAIVSAEPGTTRDYLDADLSLDGRLVTLVDTAGLRPTADHVEAEGVRRARHLIEGADVVLYVADSSVGWTAEDDATVAAVDVPGLLVWNKIDRPPAGPAPALGEPWRELLPVQLTSEQAGPALRQALGSLVDTLLGAGIESATLSRARHRDALQRAAEHLEVAGQAARDGLDEELLALDVRLALDAVGEIVGAVTPDDILNRIFASFCIGK